MYQIGIVSKNSKRLLQIQSELDQSFVLKPKVQLWADQVIDGLQAKSLDGLIIALNTIGPSQVRLIEQFRDAFEGLPLIVMGEMIGPSALKSIENLAPNIVVKHAGDVDQVPGIMEKLLNGKAVKPREHPRYTVATAVSIQSRDKKEVLVGSGRLMNLGVGGGRVRIFGRKFKVGEKCYVEVPTNIAGFSKRMPVEIVWTKDEAPLGSSSDSQLIGLQFAST